MKLDTKDVAHGYHNGEIVWICDHRRPDPNKKPIRSIPPTQVKIVDADEANKRIYYSKSCFQPIGKNGNLLKKFIPLYDNTGFRSYTGEPLNVFTTYEECNDQWVDDVQRDIDYWEKKKVTVVDEIEEKIKSLQQIQHEGK